MCGNSFCLGLKKRARASLPDRFLHSSFFPITSRFSEESHFQNGGSLASKFHSFAIPRDILDSVQRLYYIPIIVILLLGYLYLANAYIYHRIGRGNLIFPDTAHTYTLTGSSEKRVYAALGDSLTSGVGAPDYKQAYPYMVAQDLATRGEVNLKVFAEAGITSAMLISRYLTPAIESNPDIVSVLIGTNDVHNWVSATDFEARYREILTSLTKETDAEIYAISIPYIGSRFLILPPLNYYFDTKTSEFNAIIQKLAEEYDVTYVDIATPTRELFKEDGVMYATDSFHPSPLGYKQWSTLIYANIRK